MSEALTSKLRWSGFSFVLQGRETKKSVCARVCDEQWVIHAVIVSSACLYFNLEAGVNEYQRVGDEIHLALALMNPERVRICILIGTSDLSLSISSHTNTHTASIGPKFGENLEYLRSSWKRIVKHQIFAELELETLHRWEPKQQL